MQVTLNCPDKGFFVKIPPSLPFPSYDPEAIQIEECFCTCYHDFIHSLVNSENMSDEILDTLKRRFISYHSCCEGHRECLEQI